MRRLFVALAFLLLPAASWASAPTFVSASAISATAVGDSSITITLSAHQANDIILLMCWIRDVDDTMTTPSGWTAVTGTPFDRGSSARYWLFWIRAASSAESDPICERSTADGDFYGAAAVYRGAITTGDPWEVVGTPTTGTGDPSGIGTITPVIDEELVVVPVGGEDNNNAGISTSCVSGNPASFATHYVESAAGADGAITFSEGAQSTAGTTGQISVDWDTAAPVGWGGIAMGLRPPAAATTGVGWWGTHW